MTTVPFQFLDDAPPADVGFVARGETLEACFRAACEATLACMLDNPESLRMRERRAVHVEADAVDLALVELLEELIYYKDAESLFLRVIDLQVTRSEGGCAVNALLEGEEVDAARHARTGDVKAVTMHRLSVRQTDSCWEATVILDV